MERSPCQNSQENKQASISRTDATESPICIDAVPFPTVEGNPEWEALLQETGSQKENKKKSKKTKECTTSVPLMRNARYETKGKEFNQ